MRPMRVSVVGCSGSGKTTFGRALAETLGVAFVELDAVFHQPGWTELPRAGVPGPGGGADRR